MVCVADRGMIDVDNLGAMDAAGSSGKILDRDAYGPLEGAQGRLVGEGSTTAGG